MNINYGYYLLLNELWSTGNKNILYAKLHLDTHEDKTK